MRYSNVAFYGRRLIKVIWVSEEALLTGGPIEGNEVEGYEVDAISRR